MLEISAIDFHDELRDFAGPELNGVILEESPD